MQNKKLLALLTIVTLSTVSVVSSTLAAPPSNPPSANVDASFNSTSYPNTASPNILIDSVAGIYSFVQATLAQLTVTGQSKLGNLIVSSNGDISNSTSLPVTISDEQGIASYGSTATGGHFEGTQNGVYGSGNIGGYFTGSTNGILSISANGKGANMTGKDYGINALATDTLNGVGVNGSGVIGVKGSSGVAGIGIGISGTAPKIGGQFTNSTAPSNNVDLATTTASVDALGAIKNQALTISSNGDIANTSGTNPVKVNDNDGLQINNGASNVLVNGNGQVSGLVNLIGSIKFSNKLLIDAIGTISNLGTGAGGVYGLSFTDWPVAIDDDLKVGQLFNVAKSTGDISTSGNLSVKNVTSSGAVTATGGFGKIYTANGTTISMPANAYGYAGAPTCTKPADRVLSCGFSSTGQVILASTAPSGNSCTIYVKSVDTIARSVTPYVVCIDPAGSPW